MVLRVKTNVSSLTAQRNLGINNQDTQNSLQRLSSGYRINKSSDDADGLPMAETMKDKINSFAAAKRNANDGMSYLQTAEGSLNEIGNSIIRMRELAMQATNDTLDEQQRSYLNEEFTQLGKEITRIKSTTEFNGRSIFDNANSTDLKIQVGIFNAGPDGRSNDADSIDLKYEDMSDLNDSFSDLLDLGIDGPSAKDLSGGSPQQIFNTLDSSMQEVNKMRASYGALQSRLSTSISSIDIANENLNAAQSRIKDVDYAQETSKLAQSRILMLAGTSVLSQANQLPESVLTLIKQ
jgi:flagellin